MSKWDNSLIGGFPAFDCLSCLLFNEKENKYYYYTRANIITGLRNIQYATSTDLINWSSWNMIKFSKNQDEIYSKANYYLSNFTKIDGLNGYFGILKCFNAKISDKSKFKVSNNGEFQLLYSEDCVTWDIFNNILPGKLVSIENQTSIYGYIQTPDKFITLQNHRTVVDNIDDDRLSLYSFDKNRFIYADCEDVTKPGKIMTKLLNIEDPDKIFFNFTTYENGYIEVRLLDKDKRMVKPYTSSRFYKIGSNCNDSKFQLKWNKKRWDKSNVNYKEINFKEFHIEITGMNFKLYSIAW